MALAASMSFARSKAVFIGANGAPLEGRWRLKTINELKKDVSEAAGKVEESSTELGAMEYALEATTEKYSLTGGGAAEIEEIEKKIERLAKKLHKHRRMALEAEYALSEAQRAEQTLRCPNPATVALIRDNWTELFRINCSWAAHVRRSSWESLPYQLSVKYYQYFANLVFALRDYCRENDLVEASGEPIAPSVILRRPEFVQLEEELARKWPQYEEQATPIYDIA